MFRRQPTCEVQCAHATKMSALVGHFREIGRNFTAGFRDVGRFALEVVRGAIVGVLLRGSEANTLATLLRAKRPRGFAHVMETGQGFIVIQAAIHDLLG